MIYPAFFSTSSSDIVDVGGGHINSKIVCSDPIAQELSTVTIEDFEILRVLGVGTYGVVKLAKHIPSGMSVALKVLSKEHVVSTRQEKHILRERAVHSQLQHPLVARLYGTFQDDDCLYLVIEYLPGGELWSLVYSQSEDQENDDADEDNTQQLKVHAAQKDDYGDVRPPSPVSTPNSAGFDSISTTLDSKDLSVLRSNHGGLKEEYAVFYLSCILSALEYLHGQGLLYRDLKLENLVLDKGGYLKVLDFGFAKTDAQLTDECNARNLTLCGSMEYMAPEILLRQSHDHRVDAWSFGIIMYELLLGKTPFYHENPREVGRRITTESVEFPNDFEEEHPFACDLISLLLVKSPESRPASMGEIKMHKFFTRTFSSPEGWERLLHREIEPPFVPKLNGPFDTSFFQTMDEDEENELDANVEPYFEDGSNIFSDF